MMLLTFEGWCMLQCHQIPTNKPPLDFPFSLLPALTDSYFSDMILPLKKVAESEDTVKAATKDAVPTESLDVFAYAREVGIYRNKSKYLGNIYELRFICCYSLRCIR